MKTEFVLRIEIGNEATLGDANLSDIVRKVAESIAFVGITNNIHYSVRDLNGNPVGRFGRYVTEEEPEDRSTWETVNHPV